MKMNQFKLKSSIALLTSSGLLLCSLNSFAGPGTLADVPLQTSSSSEANIVFLLDNSQSMNTSLDGGTRLSKLKSSLNSVLPDLTGVNIGLFTFDSGNGARMLPTNSVYGLRLLDQSANDYATQLGYLTTAVTNLSSGSGGTILAESLQDIGRYFANDASENCGGSAGAQLKIHPDDATLTQDIACTELLGNKTHIKELPEPVAYSCQKNFAIVMSDGATRNDYDLRTTSATLTNLTHPLNDYDQDCTSDAQTAGSYTCTSYDEKSIYTYDSDGSDYLDDVAQALFEIDLRPDYQDYKNNVTTYTIGFAENTLDPNHASYNPLMESAALQAGGEYFYADDADSLTDAFTDITKTIIDQTSTSAAVTFNSSTLSSQSAVYQALFNTSRWGGELRSIPLNGFTGEPNFSCTAGTNNCWKASEQMENQAHDTSGGQTAGGRSIITYNPTSNSGVAFQMPADFTALDTAATSDDIPQAMLNDLCAGPGTGGSTSYDCTDNAKKTDTQTYLEAITDYFRGDRSQEGSSTTFKFRTRSSKLGDLVDSSPVFVGAPELYWPTGGLFPALPDPYVAANDFTYDKWKNDSVKNRDTIVYVASNDGMLHGFRTLESAANEADAGEEVLAYIPTGILSTTNDEGLHYLADPTYSHQYYNDMTPTISDVYMKYRTTGGGLATTADANDRAWRTVLLGGLRAGGRSLYLLDITDPDNFLESKADQLVMWEFAHADLGYTFSQPTIAMMNNGKFAAIFGNGYSSGENGGSGDCKAKLFVVYLEGGLDGTWTDGTSSTPVDYELYDTGAGSVPDGTPNNGDEDNCNGLSTPVVADLDGNGTADRIYAGDLKGNLWAFDTCNYTSGACASSGYGLANASPIMIAKDASDNLQPITTQPTIAYDPAGTDDDLLVIFGTGQYVTDADKASTADQTLYAVRDNDTLANGRANNKYGLDPRANNNQFVAQTLSTPTTACDGTCTARKITTNTSMSNNSDGWLIDLPIDGERIVVDPVVIGETVFFNTVIPDATTCSFGGSGWLMFVNLENGGTPTESVFDLNGNGTIGDAGDLVGGSAAVGLATSSIPSKSSFLGNYQYTSFSDTTIGKKKVKLPDDDGVKQGRMSWRELYDIDD